MGIVPTAVDSVLRTVGRTPLVRLERLEPPGGARLYAKCEFLGPANAIFDRAAAAVFEAAHHAGHLTSGRPLVAAGGTDASISLAFAASAAGHALTVVVPRSLHPERRRTLADYGAVLSVIDDDSGLEGARKAAIDIARSTHGLYLDLFEGSEIVRSYESIGRELIEALGHIPALVVCGLDLGAIPTGIARGLRTGHLVAVEPENARIATTGAFGPHLLGGLAPSAEPTALDRTVVREFDAVSDRAAWDMADRLSRGSGILAGIASGAVLAVALQRAASTPPTAEVVAVLPDSGERRFMLADLFG